MKTSIKQYGIAVVIALALVLGVSTLEAAGWSAPSGSPPSGNVDAPVNIGYNTQAKFGNLQINTQSGSQYAIGLQVFGTSIFNGNVQIGTTTGNQYATVQIVDGNQGAGKVLTSDAFGNASWGAGGSGGITALDSDALIVDLSNNFVNNSTLSTPVSGWHNIAIPSSVPSTAKAVLIKGVVTGTNSNNCAQGTAIYVRRPSSGGAKLVARESSNNYGQETGTTILPITSTALGIDYAGEYEYNCGESGNSGGLLYVTGYIQ